MYFSLNDFPKLSADGVSINATDGLVAAADVEGQLLVTSPNATYIPTIPQGRVSLYMVADGTYGAFDPACWPQTYHPKFPYFAAVSKTAASPEFYSALWRLPEAADFVALTGVPARNFGLLTEDFMRPLQDLVVTLGKKVSNHISFFPTTAHTRLLHHYCVAKRTCERLQNIAATLRDIRVQLSLFRRHWLLAMAYMRFAHLELVPGELTARPVENDLMGAWTSEGDVAEELYLRGIPVWFVRNRLCVPLHTQIGREVEFTPPPTTYRVRMCDVPVYTGPVGYHSLLATQRTTHTYYDISLNPTVCLRTIDSALNTDHPSSTTPPILASPLPASTLVTLDFCTVSGRSQAVHRSHVRSGRDKFKDFPHDWMPPGIPSWQRALSEVDRSQPAQPAEAIWPYWVPEPALIVGSQERARQERYLMNWIRARPIWISLLQQRDRPVSLVNTQGWRTYLNGIPNATNSTRTACSRRVSYIKGVFSAILQEDDIEPENGEDVEWHGHCFGKVPEALCPWVLWEIHELAFRYELMALDRACCCPTGFVEECQAVDLVARVFNGRGLWRVTHLPASDELGLFAALPYRRIHALNALRDVVARWPGCPQPLKDVAALTTLDATDTVLAFEYWLASFYVQKFFIHAGRPPVLPHFLPSSLS